MEYKRLRNQLRIHWHWIRANEDPVEVYKILKIWIDRDVANKEAKKINQIGVRRK